MEGKEAGGVGDSGATGEGRGGNRRGELVGSEGMEGHSHTQLTRR